LRFHSGVSHSLPKVQDPGNFFRFYLAAVIPQYDMVRRALRFRGRPSQRAL
jgi:hypothetical protein